MPNNEQQSVSGHFPPDWEIYSKEVKTHISSFLSSSNCIFAGELEDRTNEIFQETVLRCTRYAKGKGAEAIRKPEGFILKTARHLCLEFIEQRKKKLAREIPLSPSNGEESDEEPPPAELIYDERDEPEYILLSEEDLNDLFLLIKKLPQPCQDVVRLRSEGARLREIAQLMSMPLPKVRECLHDGQEQLRRLLSQRHAKKEQVI